MFSQSFNSSLQSLTHLQPSTPLPHQLTTLKVYISQLNECIKNKCRMKESQLKFMEIHKIYREVLEWPKEELAEMFEKHLNHMKGQIVRMRANDLFRTRLEKVHKEMKEQGGRVRKWKKKRGDKREKEAGNKERAGNELNE